MSKTAPPIYIVGCGDIGRRVARLWIQRGRRVVALSRSEDSARKLQAEGIETLCGDLDDPASLHALAAADSLLYHFAAPAPGGEGDARTDNLVEALRRDGLPAKIVYISTSGVYGDHGGAWVDESVPPNPQTARARRRLAAEESLRGFSHESGVALVVLRVGGIYAVERLPRERLERGEPVLRLEESGYSNRIHADDLATVCVAAMERGRAGEIYNVSDGNNGTMSEYFLAVAAALGIDPPPQITMTEARQQLSPAMLSYLTESRRLDNRKMLAELGVRLRYPDLATGLAELKPQR